MNFNIVESDYTTEFYSIYNKIKKDLADGLKVKDIKKKYNLSDGSWRKYYKELVADGIFKPRKKTVKEAKFYTYNNGRYHCQKFINGKKYHIGTFKCKNDAELAVKLMKECNWDINKIKEVRRTVHEQSTYKY